MSEFKLLFSNAPFGVFDEVGESFSSFLVEFFTVKHERTLGTDAFMVIEPSEFALELLSALRAGKFQDFIVKLHNHSPQLVGDNNTTPSAEIKKEG